MGTDPGRVRLVDNGPDRVVVRALVDEEVLSTRLELILRRVRDRLAESGGLQGNRWLPLWLTPAVALAIVLGISSVGLALGYVWHRMEHRQGLETKSLGSRVSSAPEPVPAEKRATQGPPSKVQVSQTGVEPSRRRTMPRTPVRPPAAGPVPTAGVGSALAPTAELESASISVGPARSPDMPPSLASIFPKSRPAALLEQTAGYRWAWKYAAGGDLPRAVRELTTMRNDLRDTPLSVEIDLTQVLFLAEAGHPELAGAAATRLLMTPDRDAAGRAELLYRVSAVWVHVGECGRARETATVAFGLGLADEYTTDLNQRLERCRNR